MEFPQLIGELLGSFEVVRGEQDCRAFGTKLPGDLSCVVATLGVHAGGGLVQLHHGQIAGEPPCWSTTPVRARTRLRSRTGSSPPKRRMLPLVGPASPSRSSTVKVLPAPLVPSRASSSPRTAERLTSHGGEFNSADRAEATRPDRPAPTL